MEAGRRGQEYALEHDRVSSQQVHGRLSPMPATATLSARQSPTKSNSISMPDSGLPPRRFCPRTMPCKGWRDGMVLEKRPC